MKPKTVMLIGGWAHPPEALEPLVAFLSGRLLQPLHAYAPATAPVGGTVWPGTDAPSPYALAFRDEMERYDTPALLIGWSLGGMIALECAAYWPEMISSVALIGSTARFTTTADYPHGHPPDDLDTMLQGLSRRTAHKIMEGFTSLCASPLSPSEAYGAQVRPCEADPENRDALRDGLMYLRDADVRPLLHDIRHPVLIQHGALDEVIPPGAGRYLSDHLMESQLMIYNDIGHSLPLTRAADVAADIADWMEQP